MSRSSTARGYCFTWNNYTDTTIDVLYEYFLNECDYMVIGKEIAPTTGTPHLQGYFHMTNTKTMSAIMKLMTQDGIALIKAKGSAQQNFDYCKKSGDWCEWGKRPSSAVNQCKLNNEHYKEWIDLSKAGDFAKCEELYPTLSIKYNSTMYRYASNYAVAPKELDGVCGEWWYGPKSTGKSTCAYALKPYLKAKNKWWNGYSPSDTRVVYIDELDHFHARWIGPDLKNWADKFPFSAETKGSTMIIRPPRLIVSSNYTIAELWSEDRELAGAIMDRFTVRMFETVYERPKIALITTFSK